MVVVNGLPNLDQMAAQIGADSLLVKPFDVTDLLESVQAALTPRDLA